jgi:ubiquinone/menaquinone biosynthesis C-methylase UbiE
MASYVFMKVLESSARRYDAGINILSLGQINKIKREIVDNYIAAGDKVLEIGCGTGTLAVLCAEKGASVFGFDMSSRMLGIAKKKIREKNLGDRVEIAEMGAIEMDKAFASETFDKVVSTLVFSELYSDEQRYVLAEAYRVLKQGGLIVIADEVRSNSVAKRVIQLLVRIPLMVITYILTQTSTKAVKGIENAIAGAGFEIVHQERRFFDSFGLYIAKKG